jgi:hypothetical protein
MARIGRAFCCYTLRSPSVPRVGHTVEENLTGGKSRRKQRLNGVEALFDKGAKNTPVIAL